MNPRAPRSPAFFFRMILAPVDSPVDIPVDSARPLHMLVISDLLLEQFQLLDLDETVVPHESDMSLLLVISCSFFRHIQ